MRLYRGITFIEILCVIGIIAVISALMFPVMSRAKMAAKVSSAKQNLKGFWQALEMYRADNNERVEYGPVSDMGLPPAGPGFDRFLDAYTHRKAMGWASIPEYTPCGVKVNDERFEGLWYFGNDIAEWPRDVKRFEGRTVVLADKNCNTSEVRVDCQYCSKRSIGITLIGEVIDRTNAEWPYDHQNFYRK